MIGSGVDFDSNPITVIFGVGEVNKIANVSVTADDLAEGGESFNIGLELARSNSQVTLRENNETSEGRIMDSTGKI